MLNYFKKGINSKITFRGKLLLVSVIFIFYCYFLFSQNRNILFNGSLKFWDGGSPPFEKSQQCLIEKFKNINEENFAFEWHKLDETVNDCSGDLFDSLPIQKLRNLDEFKYIIFPKILLNSPCETVTLGIGKDVVAEKQLLHKLGHCNFFGVDPDAEDSGQLYKDTVNGKFIQGLVGAKNGTYKATVLTGRSKYVNRILPHYSFQDLMAKHYTSKFIDYLFIDIEGDEFDLMKDLIVNPQNYPIICQINVEYHNPFNEKRNLNIYNDFYKSVTNGPYLPLNVETRKRVSFNRIYLINFKHQFCLNKYF